MSRIFLTIGAISGLLAVALGAFGTHALKNVLRPELRAIYQTANEYHFYHSLALLLIGILALHWPDSPFLKWSGWLTTAGIVVFSGSLYLLAVTGLRWLGVITPIGGLAFITGWALLAVAALKAGP